MATEPFRPGQVDTGATQAKLTFQGGPVLSQAKIAAIYVHDATGDPFPFVQEMHNFLNYFGNSERVGLLAEYNVQAPATLVRELELDLGGNAPPPPLPGHTHERHGHERIAFDLKRKRQKAAAAVSAQVQLDDEGIQTILAHLIKQERVPVPDTHTLYLLFFAPSIQISFGPDASCQDFCGYHNHFQYDALGTQVPYAVIPFPACAGCLWDMFPSDALTRITTHEVAESLTDPIAPDGWYDRAHGEIADPCVGQSRYEQGFAVQLLWSNKQQACV